MAGCRQNIPIPKHPNPKKQNTLQNTGSKKRTRSSLLLRHRRPRRMLLTTAATLAVCTAGFAAQWSQHSAPPAATMIWRRSAHWKRLQRKRTGTRCPRVPRSPPSPTSTWLGWTWLSVDGGRSTPPASRAGGREAEREAPGREAPGRTLHLLIEEFGDEFPPAACRILAVPTAGPKLPQPGRALAHAARTSARHRAFLA